MVPNGWKQTTLNKVSKRVAVGLATSVTDSYRDSGIPIIRNLNIKKGYFDASKMLYLDEKFSTKHPNKRVRAGDVITVHTGSNVGLTCVVPEEYDLAQTFTTLIVTPKENVLDSWFLNYVLNSEYGEYQALRLVVGGGKGNLNTSDFKRYPILLPTYPEQRKIAQILSTWDKAIATTEKLIDASKQQKKALMQQLLTGKKRLVDPETGKAFEGEWKKVELGELLNYKQPTPYLVKSTEYSDEYVTPVLTAGKTFILGYSNENFGIFNEELPAIIFDDFTTASKFVDFPFKAKSSAMKILVAKKGISIKFVYEAMQMLNYPIGGHQRHWISIFAYLVIGLPSSCEQQKIASVLTAADKEIELLVAKLAHLKQEKKALMQQLLTGKRRVSLSS